MVYCPIHNKYYNGKKSKRSHIQKENCSFMINYKKPKDDNYKYNKRDVNNKNSDNHRQSYIWKRKRRKRSEYRTNRKNKGLK
jgi:hypothetical protein